MLEIITTGLHRVSAQELPVCLLDNQAEYSRLMGIVSGSFLFAQASGTTLLLSERPGVSDHSFTNRTSVFINFFHFIPCPLNSGGKSHQWFFTLSSLSNPEQGFPLSILNPYVPNYFPAKLLQLWTILPHYLPEALVPCFHNSISAFDSRRTPLYEAWILKKVLSMLL